MYLKLFCKRSTVQLKLLSIRLRSLFCLPVIYDSKPANRFIFLFKRNSNQSAQSFHFNSFTNNIVTNYLLNKMSLSSAPELPLKTTDGSVVEKSSDCQNRVANMTDKCDVKTVYRNVQTQHGDYRSVDEENIVVLQRCLSPEPIRWLEDDAKEAAAISGDDEMKTDEIKSLVASSAEEQVVWIEPFHDVKVCSVYFCFLIV